VSYPLSWQAAYRPSYRRRACPFHCQTVRPCCEVHWAHPSSLIRCQVSFPCTPIQRRSRISGHKEIALATGVSCSKYYNRYVPGPTCRGLALMYVPPLSYKRGGTLRYNTRSFRLKPSWIQIKLMSNTTHSGVGYYAPTARTTLNPRVFLCVHPPNLVTSRTLRPFLILGFRAGAFRHLARNFLSDIWRAR
jgi:hypothetical protein